ncbi:MAG: SLC13 family permease [Rhodovibrionaceae bacterium]
MAVEQIILFAILGTALAFFAWGRFRYDLVAVGALLAATIAGIVPSAEAFSGFGHPAVITVAAILIITRAIRNSGAVDAITRLLQPLTRNTTTHVFGLTAMVAVCSAFMNNVGALAVMLPVALQSAYSTKRAPSTLLLPLSFGSLLGGLMTLIGTPPNIVISSLRRQETGEPFAMFDFGPVGIAVALAGIAFISLIGWRLLPTRAGRSSGGRPIHDIGAYIAEVRMPRQSPYVGRRLVDLETLSQADVSVVALLRRKDRMLAPSGFLRLQAGDILTVESDAGSLRRLVEKAELEMVGAGATGPESLTSERVGLVEAVVTPNSRMEGRTARSLRLHTRYGVNLLAVSRQGEPINERLGQLRFQAGDVLLLQGEHDAMPEAFSALGCLPLAERGLNLGSSRGLVTTPLIFAAAILLVVFGLLPPHVAFVAAALGIVLTGELSLRELYDSIDWPIIVLLGSLIPVGMALETTGGTQTIAAPILALAGDAPVWLILGLLMLVTMLVSDIMNNAATAVLMGPIGISIAKGMELSIDPFLMAVAIGASSTFLTPIGHQSNLLVMGPGGYRFGDYWRMGLPLDALILVVAVPAILVVWPV